MFQVRGHQGIVYDGATSLLGCKLGLSVPIQDDILQPTLSAEFGQSVGSQAQYFIEISHHDDAFSLGLALLNKGHQILGMVLPDVEGIGPASLLQHGILLGNDGGGAFGLGMAWAYLIGANDGVGFPLATVKLGVDPSAHGVPS